eukprot:Em0008g1188a
MVYFAASTPGPLEEEQTVPVVPLSLQPTALKATHDIISSEHQGVEKTLQRLKRTAYWFGMAKGHRAMLQELYGVPKVQAANANTDSNDQYSNWTPLADAGSDTFAEANIGLLNSHGIQYTVSTGGANGLFTCSSTVGADRFLNRYLGPNCKRKNPKLTISFTLASSAYSINDLDDNKMCDMGASAIQAAKNLNKKYGVPFTEIALTPMIGMNDVTNEIFTIEDMKKVLEFGAKVGLAGLHYWSFDRDCHSLVNASPTCSGVEQKPFQYYNLLMGRGHAEL